MDIAALSTVLSQSQIKQEASISVMKLAMNSAQNQAAHVTEMLGKLPNQATQAATTAPSVQSHLGGRVDVRV